MGAKQGRDFGYHYKGNIKVLKMINDFTWLKNTFNQTLEDHDYDLPEYGVTITDENPIST